MSELTVLLDGLVMGESPRWHDDRLWVCDWGAHELLTVDPDGRRELVDTVDSFPFCIDWLPDRALLVVAGGDARLLRRDADGSMATYAELGSESSYPWNEVVTDGNGNAYVNGIGFDLAGGGPPGPGLVVVVTPHGDVRRVADDLAFPNGMAVTSDGGTLLVAESYAGRITAFDIARDGDLSNRRVWAQLDDAAPDGICLDAEGAVWFADVPHRSCVRVAEGGRLLDRVELDRGGFSCALGGRDGRTLYAVTAEWTGLSDATSTGRRTGQVVAVRVDVPAADRPR